MLLRPSNFVHPNVVRPAVLGRRDTIVPQPLGAACQGNPQTVHRARTRGAAVLALAAGVLLLPLSAPAQPPRLPPMRTERMAVIPTTPTQPAIFLPERRLQVDGTPRRYYLTVETTGSAAPPLIVFLHTAGGGPGHAARRFGWVELAAREKFTVAFAEGTTRPAPRGNIQQAGAAFEWLDQGVSPGLTAHNVRYLQALVEDALQHRALDPRRVYLVGYGEGGTMAHHAAAAMPGRIAGLASVFGSVPEDFHTSSALPILYYGDAAAPALTTMTRELALWVPDAGTSVRDRYLRNFNIPATGASTSTLAPSTEVSEFHRSGTSAPLHVILHTGRNPGVWPGMMVGPERPQVPEARRGNRRFFTDGPPASFELTPHIVKFLLEHTAPATAP